MAGLPWRRRWRQQGNPANIRLGFVQMNIHLYFSLYIRITMIELSGKIYEYNWFTLKIFILKNVSESWYHLDYSTCMHMSQKCREYRFHEPSGLARSVRCSADRPSTSPLSTELFCLTQHNYLSSQCVLFNTRISPFDRPFIISQHLLLMQNKV